MLRGRTILTPPCDGWQRCLSIAAIRGARQVASPQARCPQVRARLLGANLGGTPIYFFITKPLYAPSQTASLRACKTSPLIGAAKRVPVFSDGSAMLLQNHQRSLTTDTRRDGVERRRFLPLDTIYPTRRPGTAANPVSPYSRRL